MKSATSLRKREEPLLKIVKKDIEIKEKSTTRIYINTLMPGFSYKNSLGENISPKKCIYL